MATKKKKNTRSPRKAATKPKSGRQRTSPRSATSRASADLRPAEGEVIVRMYRQGLGDCFLLAFGTDKPTQPVYILIDCGVHFRQPEGSDRLARVMADIVRATGGHLHVVVATHEHADHLSGFVQKGSPFLKQELTIDKVWLAWTEIRGDRQADRLRKKRGAALRTIEKALKELRSRPGMGENVRADQLADWLSFVDPPKSSADTKAAAAEIARRSAAASSSLAVAGAAPRPASSCEVALRLLASMGDVKYCEPGDILKLPGVGNVRAYVLGPPREETLLKKDQPSKIRGSGKHGEYKEVYFSGGAANRALQLSPRLAELQGDSDIANIPEEMRYPFLGCYRREFTERDDGKLDWDANYPPNEDVCDFFNATYCNVREAWRRVDNDWLYAADVLALHLDSDTNNTSVVLAFELGDPGEGRVLFFPADAQVGNWLSWRRREYGPRRNRLTVDDLLARTVLYKVGHHGSHNATVRRDSLDTTESEPYGVPYGLELMRDIVAMIPVDRAAAERKMPIPWAMPHEPLYRRLRTKAQRRVLRSDQRLDPLSAGDNAPDRVPTKTTWAHIPGLTDLSWRKSVETFGENEGTEGPLYYDVLVPCR